MEGDWIVPAPLVKVAAGAILWFFLAPAVVAGVVPWRISGWRFEEPLLGWAPLRGLGAFLVAAAVPVLVDAFVRFVREGRGTPAPYQPTRHLVVSGPYRYVRNPMYIAAVATILGQALLFGSSGLLAYAVGVAAVFHLWVWLYEEPWLRQRYGAQYERYCREVRRWWPRLSSYDPGTARGLE